MNLKIAQAHVLSKALTKTGSRDLAGVLLVSLPPNQRGVQNYFVSVRVLHFIALCYLRRCSLNGLPSSKHLAQEPTDVAYICVLCNRKSFVFFCSRFFFVDTCVLPLCFFFFAGCRCNLDGRSLSEYFTLGGCLEGLKMVCRGLFSIALEQVSTHTPKTKP